MGRTKKMTLKNGEKEKRERFITCSEENYLDDKVKDIKNRGSEKCHLQNMKDKTPCKSKNKKKRGRPSVKTSEKQISKKINESRSKKYGFVQRVQPRTTAYEKLPLVKAKDRNHTNRRM